jgi:hypothetical protein
LVGDCRPAGAAESGPSRPAAGARTRPTPLREVALVALLFLGYKLGRAAVAGRVGLADANADRVWGFERWLRLPSEAAVQRVLLHSEALVRAVNAFYAYVHFPVAAAFLVWLYVRRPADYLLGRRMLAAVTAAALVVHVSFPLAPPRLISALGLVDTAAWLGPAVYGTPATDKISNQYAAMPSLHVGWALVVALVLMHGFRSRWRYLWLAYPAVTTLVVVGSANHYWLDAVAAVILVAVAFRVFSRLPSARRTAGTQAALDPRPAAGAQPVPDDRHPALLMPAQWSGRATQGRVEAAVPPQDRPARTGPIPSPRTEDRVHPA